MTKKTIHHAIPSQLSRHINEEYPLFVEFLKAYYEWLETPDSPYYHLKNHMSYLDFQKSLDSYVDLMKNEFLPSIPEKVLANKELLIKYSKQLHQSIGTERSFKFIFNILYGEEVEISYPRDMLLRSSDGKWVEDEHLLYCSNSGMVDEFLYRRIKQEREIFPGIFEYASATVNKVIKRYAGKFSFAELYVSDVEGVLDIDYPISIDGYSEWILPICAELEIVNAGQNYIPDNILEYQGDEDWSYSVTSTEPGRVDSRYTTIFSASEIRAKLKGETLHNFFYDGRFLYHSAIEPGDSVEFTFPVYPGLLATSLVDSSTGSVSTVSIIDTPFGITSPQQYVGKIGGEGLIVRAHPALTRKMPGYFSNSDGFLSDNNVLQDSDRYQDFSYIIKAGIGIEQYGEMVQKVLHPAGWKMFGEVNILELILLMIRQFTMEVDVLNLDTSIGSTLRTDNHLYNRYGFIEDWKYKFESEGFKTGNFAHIVVGDIINNPDLPVNVHDSMIEIVA